MSTTKKTKKFQVGNLFRKATLGTSEIILPKDILGFAFNNVGKVRRDVLNAIFQEIGKHLSDIADNYTIKVKAELNFERKKKQK